MIFVILQIIRNFVLSSALPLAIIVDDQVPGQPHQPVLQIALFWILLVEETINANENFLLQVFSGISSGGKSIGEIVDTTAVSLDNFFPGRTIACAASSD